jgi:hypothetical protein
MKTTLNPAGFVKSVKIGGDGFALWPLARGLRLKFLLFLIASLGAP